MIDYARDYADKERARWLNRMQTVPKRWPRLVLISLGLATAANEILLWLAS